MLLRLTPNRCLCVGEDPVSEHPFYEAVTGHDSAGTAAGGDALPPIASLRGDG